MRGQGAFALGIDEAGRGPVLGPMVYGGYFCPVGAKSLAKFGYKDSKKLTETEREALFEKAKESGHGWRVIVLQASELSNKMLRRSKYNLNLISHDAAAELIQVRTSVSPPPCLIPKKSLCLTLGFTWKKCMWTLWARRSTTRPSYWSSSPLSQSQCLPRPTRCSPW